MSCKPTAALFLFICLLPAFFSRAQPAKLRTVNFSSVPDKARIFGEGIISTNLYESNMAISPDGNELFYTVEMPQNVFSMIIYMGKDSKGNWSSPEVAPFSGNYMDLEPAFSPDGKKLFFVSNRPLQGDTAKDFDIWCLTKTNGQWSNPINLQAPVNTSANEFYPSIAANGNLYFTAERPNGKGKEDIHVARWEHDHYLEPVSLDSGVNSALYEFNAYVSPDEQFIIFSSFGRKDDQGKGDLYMSIKDAHGNWQPAKNLSIINSARLDYCPFVSFDKKILFFTSEQSNPKGSYPHKKASYSDLIQLANGANNGSSNIYWISFDKVMESIK